MQWQKLIKFGHFWTLFPYTNFLSNIPVINFTSFVHSWMLFPANDPETNISKSETLLVNL